MHTVGLEDSFLAIWRGLFQRTELHAWELERTTREERRGTGSGGRERGRRHMGQREGKGGGWLCNPGWPLLASCPQGICLFMFVSPIGLWAPKSPRSCLILYPQTSAQAGEKGLRGKCERSSGASTRCQAPHRRHHVSPGTHCEPLKESGPWAPRLPRAAWDCVDDLTMLTWYNFKWG